MKLVTNAYLRHEEQNTSISFSGNHEDYVFISFMNAGILELNGNLQHTKSGACIFIAPYSSYLFNAHKAVDYNIMHLSHTAKELLVKYNIKDNTVYYPANISVINSHIKCISDEFIINPKLYSDNYIKAKFTELLIHISRSDITGSAGNKQDNRLKIEMLRDFLINENKFSLTVNQMAENIGMSRSYFHKLYKQLYGISPAQDIMNIRIQLAKSKLLQADKSISDISNEVGFISTDSFRHYFKKNVGMSPIQYRKEVAK